MNTWNLLGKIIEKVSGEKYAGYLKNHIFDKAEMTHTLVMNEENRKNIEVKGYEKDRNEEDLHPSLLFAVGGVVSTKEDLSAYLTIVIFSNMGGEWNYGALRNEIASIVFNKRLWFYHKIQ